MEFISGAFSGIVQTIVGYPLDTMKVLQQNKIVSKQYYNKGFMYALFSNTILNSILFKWFNDFEKRLDNAYMSGFISGSLSFPIVFVVDSFKIRHQTLSFPQPSILYANGKTITFMCESSAMALYFGNYKSLIDCHVSPFMAGGISGTITWLIGYPLDVIKTRQLTYNITIKKAIQMGSFHKGLSICLVRAFLVNSFGFYSYEYIESRIKKRETFT